MDNHNQFTEEMLRQLYQRRGYQVMRLCSEVSADRQKTMELTFQAFGEAHRRLAVSEQPLTAEYQDQVLLECTRRIVTEAMPLPEQPEVQPVEDVLQPVQPPEDPVPTQELPLLEDLLTEEPADQKSADQQELPVPEEAPTMVEKFNNMQAEEPAPLDLTDTSGSSFGWGLLVLVLVLIVMALLWAIWGIAQNIFPIPQLDLGYQWFNTNVYPLF